MQKCTLCGKELQDIMVDVSLTIVGKRKTVEGAVEDIPNGQQTSREFLCKDCFDKFVDSLSETLIGE